MRAVRVVLVLMLLAPVLAQAQPISENAIEQMMKRLDAAINAKDADALVGFMSDDVRISMTVKVAGNTQTIQVGKAEYQDMLKQGWASASDYRYSRSNTRIDIKNKTQATVSSDIQESMILNGQPLNATSQEKASVEVVKGKLLITGIDAFSNM